jgi:hypothetical protein
MFVFVQDAAYAVASSHVESGYPVGIGELGGQWVERPGVCDALAWTVSVIEVFELPQGFFHFALPPPGLSIVTRSVGVRSRCGHTCPSRASDH